MDQCNNDARCFTFSPDHLGPWFEFEPRCIARGPCHAFEEKKRVVWEKM